MIVLIVTTKWEIEHLHSINFFKPIFSGRVPKNSEY